MEKLSIEKIAEFIDGNFLIQNKRLKNIEYISTSSNDINKNTLFIPLIGEKHDAHDFLDDAYNNGCRNFIIDKNHEFNKDGINLIEVEDTLDALRNISKMYREMFDIPFVAVTGSVGKTTTRDIIYSVLNQKYNTLKTIGNFNNQIGLPKTIFNLKPEHEIAVVEMGMHASGQIEKLANIVKPEIAVITNIGLSHILNLKTKENIFLSKMEIASNLKKNDFLIINGDDEYLKTLKEKELGYKLLSYGFSSNNDIYCSDFIINNEQGNITFKFVYNDKEEEMVIPSLAKHNILNALAAILIGDLCLLSMEEIKKGLSSFEMTELRLDIINKDDLVLINDTYNASYDSILSAIGVLKTFNKRHVAIIGDILELGDYSLEVHKQLGKEIDVDLLITIGEEAKYIYEEAKALNKNVYYFEDKDSFIKKGLNLISKDDAILFKASRGMAFETLVEYFNNEY